MSDSVTSTVVRTWVTKVLNQYLEAYDPHAECIVDDAYADLLILLMDVYEEGYAEGWDERQEVLEAQINIQKAEESSNLTLDL